MKLLLCFLILGSCPLWAQTSELAEFDGSTPILGLFDEPLPDTFYTENYQEAFDSKANYRTSFKVPTYDNGITAYLINEEQYDNHIVISAVSKEGQFRNYLVKIGPLSELAIDLAPLAGFDHAVILSLSAFQIQLDRVVIRNNRGTVAPEVQAPVKESSSSSMTGTCNSDGFGILVNNVAPSTPGSNAAWAILNYDSGVYFLSILFPLHVTKPYHAASVPFAYCNGQDKFGTRSGTGRYLNWFGMLNLRETNYASAQCVSTAEGDSCYVEGYPGVRASWAIQLNP